MPPCSRYAIGVLSGTSCDGIDATCCRIEGQATPENPFDYDAEVVSHVERPYSQEFRDRLLALCDRESGRIDEACRLNVALGAAFADAANAAREQANLAPEDVTAVASHGHTAWHIPEQEPLPSVGGTEGGRATSRSTLQLGDPATIAERTGTAVVSDFRSRDVAVGGHGAPLAPFVDLALFADDSRTRAIQNIGGIGNCTILPPNPSRDDVTAFDTGPGNMVIDAVVTTETSGELTYDVDGKLAAAGTPNDELIEAFLDDPYFHEEPPKTTGREYFGREFVANFLESGEHLSTPDLVASATMLTARSIARAYVKFVNPAPDEAIVCGGGAFNPTLLAMLRDELDCSIRTLDEFGLGPDRKEAVLFAVLGIATLDGVPANVPEATGAERPVVLGSITCG